MLHHVTVLLAHARLRELARVEQRPRDATRRPGAREDAR